MRKRIAGNYMPVRFVVAEVNLDEAVIPKDKHHPHTRYHPPVRVVTLITCQMRTKHVKNT